ncbi:MAG: hypothetical protein ACK4LQ_04830 [Pararhodobacter sp.]
MARGARSAGYSRMVALMKLVLPLSALVLLSMVFLLARPVDPNRAIPLADIDVEDRARDPRLSGARFAGVTEDGAALRIITETARSDPLAALRFHVTGLELHIDGPRGESVRARAGSGTVDRGEGGFAMEGGVEISASPGYRLESEIIHGLLDSTSIEVPSPLSGAAPAGMIEAGNLRIIHDTTLRGGYTLVFGGGVRLVYHPDQ